MKILATIILILSMSSMLVFAQSNKYQQNLYFSGYERPVEGQLIAYHSFHPEASQALISRCTDGNMPISWKTDAPEIYNNSREIIYFTWLCSFSSGTSTGNHRFMMKINGQEIGYFITYKDSSNISWYPSKPNQLISLTFLLINKDHVNDCHGYMSLGIPASIANGDSITIEISGAADNSRDWYMTYMHSLKTSLTASISPTVILKDSIRYREMNFFIESPLPSVQANISIRNKQIAIVDAGYKNVIEHGPASVGSALFPESEFPDSIQISVKILDQLINKTLYCNRVSIDTIFLITHSHNDIGYTDIQPNILKLQTDNLSEALLLIKASRDYPDGSRYKWNSEINWPLEIFLEKASVLEKNQMIYEIRQGNIGVNGTYCNQMTGNCKAEELMRLTETCRKFRDLYGIQIKSAMISDIPGLSWSMVSALHQSGIRYLSSGPNPFDRIGWSTHAFGDKPFYWISQSGKEKILVWVAGKGYSMFHQNSTIEAFSTFPDKLFNYINLLNDSSYPYNMLQLRVALYSDNGPNDSTLSNYVRKWNEYYLKPKLVIATTDEMFQAFERRYADSIPYYSGDYTPYWEDGALSTAYELGLNRNNSEKLNQLEIAYCVLDPAAYNNELFYKAWKNIALFSEHTWGAFNSISDPDNENVKAQWHYKQQYAIIADSMTTALSSQLLPQNSNGYFEVINTLSNPRSGILTLFPNEQYSDVIILDEQNREVPSQLMADGRIIFYASNIPALGSSFYRIKKRKKPRATMICKGNSIESPNYRIEIDLKTGAVISLYDKSTKQELCNNQGINKYIYTLGLNANHPEFSYDPLVRITAAGPLVYEMEVIMQAPGAKNLVTTYTLTNPDQGIQISNSLYKLPIREKEAAYFAFDFRMENVVNRFDAGWGYYRAEEDQLPGSCKDYFYAMRWADVSDDTSGILIVVDEAPLLEIGQITDETPHNLGSEGWLKSISYSPTLFSYILNNYWHTNFKADQEGPMFFNYSLYPHKAFDPTFAYLQSQSYHQPLLLRYTDKPQACNSLFTIQDSAIVLTFIKPADDGKGYIIRLFNTSASARALDIEWQRLVPQKIFLSNNLEDRLAEINFPLIMMGIEVLTIRIE